MKPSILTSCLFLTLTLGCGRLFAAPPVAAPEQHWRLIAEYPHAVDAFTEGLVYAQDKLWESTGEVGHSSFREVDLQTGKILHQIDIPPPYFGEGLAFAEGRWLQLTWRSNIGFIYDAQMKKTGQFGFASEGWGLAYDGRRLIQSDGSSALYFLDPASFETKGEVRVHDGTRPVAELNELEFARGRVYANVWLTDRVVIIDPVDGHVTGWWDLSMLHQHFTPPPRWNPTDDVLNGIAYNADNGHFYVTGKHWPKVFEIEPTDAAP